MTLYTYILANGFRDEEQRGLDRTLLCVLWCRKGKCERAHPRSSPSCDVGEATAWHSWYERAQIPKVKSVLALR